MLILNRCKHVGVEKEEGGRVVAYARLDDLVHGFTLRVEFDKDGLEILSVEGEMSRVPYPYCRGALEALDSAVGLKIERGLTALVDEKVGRRGCPHMANLLLESCHAVIEGSLVPYLLDGERSGDIRGESARRWLEDNPRIKDTCAAYSGEALC